MTPCHSFSNPRHRQLESRSAVRDGNGAARGIRTPDPLITNEVLYQLSYCGIAIVAIREAALLPPPPALGKAGKGGMLLPDRKSAAAHGRLFLGFRHIRRCGREDHRSWRR